MVYTVYEATVKDEAAYLEPSTAFRPTQLRGQKGAVVLPFEQFGQITVNREGCSRSRSVGKLAPIWRARRRRRVRRCSSVLSIIGVPLLPVLGRMDRPEFPFMAVNDASEILNDCCCAVTAN
jgi:hypothetical protein